jgi:hypothetical protein
LSPSAARGILAAIFLKPEFDWVVLRIAVLKMGRGDLMAVNEVKFRGNKPVVVTDRRRRIQITRRILRDVEYIIEAEPVILDPGTAQNPNSPGKYINEFRKRMCGKKPFWQTPHLGLREFVCRVSPVTEFPQRGGDDVPDMRIPGMLVGISHGDQRRDKRGSFPYFADLNMVNGIVEVPYFLGATFQPGVEL